MTIFKFQLGLLRFLRLSSFRQKLYGAKATRVSLLCLLTVASIPESSHAATLSSSYASDTQASVQTPPAKQEEALDKLLADIKYIRQTTYTLLENSVKFCQKQTIPFIGAFFTNQYDFDANFHAAARERFSLNEELSIFQLLPGFPAQQQGLLAGDILLSIDNIPFSYGENSLPSAYNLLQKKLRSRRPSKITVRRGRHEVAFSVTPVDICNFPPALSNSTQAYAHGNGSHIIISKGLLETVKTKAQLASIITHELAHNILRHPTFQQASVSEDYQFELKSAVIGLNTLHYNNDWQEPPYSQAFELEADYIGIKLMALSNFPISDAGLYLRKISSVDDGGRWDKWQIKHPTTLNRFVAIEQTINEIKQKKRDGDITFTDGADLDKLRRIRESRLANSENPSKSSNYSQHDEARVWAEKSFNGLQSKDWAQVIRTASTAIALDSKYVVPYINRSLAYINKGEYQKAIADADKAIDIQPKNAKALNNRGYAYQMLDKRQLAKADYKLACELKESAACQNYKEITGYRLEEVDFAIKQLLDKTYSRFSNKDWDGVINLSSKVLELQANNTVALVNRAGALAEKGRLRESLADCNRAIEIDPNYGLAYHNRGYVYELMEKYTNSVVEYKASCDLGISASCSEYKRVLALKQSNGL